MAPSVDSPTGFYKPEEDIFVRTPSQPQSITTLSPIETPLATSNFNLSVMMAGKTNSSLSSPTTPNSLKSATPRKPSSPPSTNSAGPGIF